MKRILKGFLKIVAAIVVLVLMLAGYLYFRLHNSIENVLVADENWRSEVLEFPLIFAEDLDYTGEEYIRFAPGWGEQHSEGYFSYVFLWMIEESLEGNVNSLEHIIEVYFDGLMNTGAITNFNFFKKIPASKATIQQIEEHVFEGSVTLYDEFFAKEMITLNITIKTENCLINQKNIIWFYLSPKEREHPIWTELTEVKLNFRCNP